MHNESMNPEKRRRRRAREEGKRSRDMDKDKVASKQDNKKRAYGLELDSP
jgi:hypothetical protein